MTASASERRVLFVCTHNAGRSIIAAALSTPASRLACGLTQPVPTRPMP
jgi:hypothetical protein